MSIPPLTSHSLIPLIRQIVFALLSIDYLSQNDVSEIVEYRAPRQARFLLQPQHQVSGSQSWTFSQNSPNSYWKIHPFPIGQFSTTVRKSASPTYKTFRQKVFKTKRYRITVQIREEDRQRIDGLLYDHKARSVSDVIRMALRLRWIDVSGNVITINRPVKGHYPRQIQVSNNLISMLNSLNKTSENVFSTTYQTIARCYNLMRKKVALKLNNPRIVKITLTTFRHWGATMLYHQTRNILLVKKLLGHKKIENTMKYTQLIQFKDDDYEVATASTSEEAKELGKAGFEKYDEFNGIHLYRKPKRFVSLA